mgnify:CR=1 FL=1
MLFIFYCITSIIIKVMYEMTSKLNIMTNLDRTLEYFSFTHVQFKTQRISEYGVFLYLIVRRDFMIIKREVEYKVAHSSPKVFLAW